MYCIHLAIHLAILREANNFMGFKFQEAIATQKQLN